MKIGAGIVTYNPEVERLKKNLRNTLNQVELVIIYDNNSKNVNQIENLVQDFDRLLLIKSKKNLGLAHALNCIFDSFDRKKYDWIISLDQDSIIQDETIKTFSKYTKNSEVAIVCPFVVDSRRKYMDYKYTKSIEDVSMCITSGSLTCIKHWRRVGKFDECLFIDLIDNDFCKRLLINGCKIIRVNSILMNQEFGKIMSKPRKVEHFYIKLGTILKNENLKKFSYKKIVDPARVYYTNRNIIYLNKKFAKYGGIGYEDNYNAKSYLGFFISFSVASLIRGTDKKSILKSIVLGIRDGKRLADTIISS